MRLCIECKEILPISKFEKGRNICQWCRYILRITTKYGDSRHIDLIEIDIGSYNRKLANSLRKEKAELNRELNKAEYEICDCTYETSERRMKAKAQASVRARQRNREKIKERKRSAKYKEVRNVRLKTRRATDPLFSLKCRITTSIYNRISGHIKSTTIAKLGLSIEEIMGCSLEYLLSLRSDDALELDHIFPLSRAKTIEEYLKLWHHSNLRWITRHENATKQAKVTEEGLLIYRELNQVSKEATKL